MELYGIKQLSIFYLIANKAKDKAKDKQQFKKSLKI